MDRNVIVFMLDQQNYRCLGYAGHPVIKTPNIDRLRNDSVDFSCCYVQNGYCLPSRTSYLSGQYLFSHRQYGFTGLVPEDTPSMGMYFNSRGYRTALVGKAHVNSFGERFGFDEFVPTLPEDMYRATNPSVSYLSYCREHGLPYPTDQVHGDSRQPGNVYGVSSVPAEHSQERYTADQAIRIIEAHNSAAGSAADSATEPAPPIPSMEKAGDVPPLFLTISFDRPHPPITPSPEYADLYPPESIPIGIPWTPEQLSRKPEYIRRYAQSKDSLQKMGESEFRQKLSLYYALITHIDAEIGRILESLKKNVMYENAVIAFCSDHGDLAGYVGLSNKYSNRCYYEHIVRTPMLIKFPEGRHAGKTVGAPVEAVDLFPTLCVLSGDRTPSTELDGKDLTMYVEDEQAAVGRHGETAFSESYSIKMIRDGRYKLIYTVVTGDRELYDLEADPDEAENLYGRPEYAETVRRLKLKLIEKVTASPSRERSEYIDALFDSNVIASMGGMGKLAKWNDGIMDGGGFWMIYEEPYRMSVFPCKGELILEKEDTSLRESKDFRTYGDLTGDEADPEIEDRLLDRLIDYIFRGIRPVSVMAEL